MTADNLTADAARRYRRAAFFGLWLAFAGSGLAYAAAKPTTHTVIIEAVQFAQSPVYAKVGDTVVWVNKDPFPHTATAPGRFDSGTIQSGGSWRFKLKTKGSFAYICTLHPTMKGSIIVK